ncbi:conserved membrane hypothetical protein [Candidatus Desulfarcum epimagneticum]|uniref:DUF2062 domain-containing protein n=1 Tax=uncultured Desulfobacteraceae bacterium TaxID=218296 RepID=A0A484HDV1_9BACT|nr:conserved membrane hypothetical protein [uncultured Desulfobacteraceae bacterium]
MNNDLTPKKKTGMKARWAGLLARVKKLNGNPRYVAMGMAIGVFVGVTPTIPFHTAIALALAFVFRASKPAAAIGVWFSNPVTIPFFYYGSYKTGAIFMGDSLVPLDSARGSMGEILAMGGDVLAAMLAGGVILGILPGVAAYFITLKIMRSVRSAAKSRNSA